MNSDQHIYNGRMIGRKNKYVKLNGRFHSVKTVLTARKLFNEKLGKKILPGASRGGLLVKATD